MLIGCHLCHIAGPLLLELQAHRWRAKLDAFLISCPNQVLDVQILRGGGENLETGNLQRREDWLYQSIFWYILGIERPPTSYPGKVSYDSSCWRAGLICVLPKRPTWDVPKEKPNDAVSTKCCLIQNKSSYCQILHKFQKLSAAKAAVEFKTCFWQHVEATPLNSSLRTLPTCTIFVE